MTFQTLFDPYYITLYNVLYTSLPVLVMGLLDQVNPYVTSLVYCYAECSVHLPILL